MSETSLEFSRQCVFCGQRPASRGKNKEHVVPQWLLELTGSSKTKVSFGSNYSTHASAPMAWQGFTMPACVPCNDHYARLEGNVKWTVAKLLDRSPLPANDYIELLDWLDKVRIGVWLATARIKHKSLPIDPKFRIASRIGTKDRLVAVIPTNSPTKGLDAWGAETFIFHLHPSCFALRINDMVLLSASSDFLFAGRLGFPAPKQMFMDLDYSAPMNLYVDDFYFTRSVKRSAIRAPLPKASVVLYQPILSQANPGSEWCGYFGCESPDDPYLMERTYGDPVINSSHGKFGKPYVERNGAIQPIENPLEEIDFENIPAQAGKTGYERLAMLYDLQRYVFDTVRPRNGMPEDLSKILATRNEAASHNVQLAKLCRKLAHQHSSQRAPIKRT